MKFEEVAQKALENRKTMKKYRNSRSFTRWIQVTQNHLVPKLGHIDIEDINGETIVETLAPIWREHTPTAAFTRAVLDYIIGYAIHRRWRSADYNPAKWKDCLSFDLPPVADIHTVQHHKAATVGELQRVMPKLMHSKFIGQRATAFGILTALRASEFTQAKWSEIDLDNKVFNIPPERCKVRRNTAFRVPLSSQAIELLREVKAENLDSEYVFYSKITGKAVTPFVARQVMRKFIGEDSNVTAHGNRAAFSSWCAETGQDTNIREMCLMHNIGNAVSRAYDRSDIFEHSRLLMQQWANAIYHN